MSCNQHNKIFFLGFKSTWPILDKGTKPMAKLNWIEIYKTVPYNYKSNLLISRVFFQSKHVQYDSISRKRSMIPKTDNRQCLSKKDIHCTKYYKNSAFDRIARLIYETKGRKCVSSFYLISFKSVVLLKVFSKINLKKSVFYLQV